MPLQKPISCSILEIVVRPHLMRWASRLLLVLLKNATRSSSSALMAPMA